MADYLNSALSYLGGHIEWALSEIDGQCESPIERGLLYGFVALRLVDRRIRLVDLPTACPVLTEWDAEVHVQHEVGKYRVDFAIHITDGKELSQWVAIECDGHDYHERTREQAQRDKARDRDLTELGYRILRFTGSEIYRDNMACATQIHRFIMSVAEGGK
jgi:very-short-patch-repair endonuclease